MKKVNIIYLLCIYLLLTSYFTSSRKESGPKNQQGRRLSLQEKTQVRDNLVYTAQTYLNHSGIDCSGLILRIFDQNKIIIIKEQSVRNPGANGVKIIYDTLRRYHKIYFSSSQAQKGDLIFFNNTYDKNGNHRSDDFLTHIAMITEIAEDGTIKFIHSTGSGVKCQAMNLRDKSNPDYNAYIRNRSSHDTAAGKYLAGELFYCFGTIF